MHCGHLNTRQDFQKGQRTLVVCCGKPYKNLDADMPGELASFRGRVLEHLEGRAVMTRLLGEKTSPRYVVPTDLLSLNESRDIIWRDDGAIDRVGEVFLVLFDFRLARGPEVDMSICRLF